MSIWTPSDGDLHQMYVYSKYYEAKKVALLYPKTNGNESIHGNFVDDDSPCDMLFLPCFQENHQAWEEKICDIVKGWMS